MKLAPWFLAVLAPFAVIGFSGSYYGHVAVLMLTFGIFFGTLSLGKRTSAQTGASAVKTPLIPE
ncbi:MAG: hypothetical protein MUF54_05355 [Polyangiaceae bacterium]|jgi:hypothetical protein|nr:hypothetical protein [Polyangiaceae bacterium]